MTYIYEALLKDFEYFDSLSQITEDVFVTKSKDGLHIFKSKVSMAEKLNIKDGTNLVSPELCDLRILSKERTRTSRAAFIKVRSIVRTDSKYSHLQARFEDYDLNEGIEEYARTQPEELIGFCREIALIIGIDTTIKYQDTEEIDDEEGDVIAMQLKPEIKKDLIKEELEDLGEGDEW